VMLSKQDVRCTICGDRFQTDFSSQGGYGRDFSCCSKECWQEREWRKALSVLGKPYRQREYPPSGAAGGGKEGE
jgi:hypothetical protein